MGREDPVNDTTQQPMLDSSTLRRLILIGIGLIALLLVATVPAGQTASTPEPCNDSISDFGTAPLIVTDIRGDSEPVIFVLRNTGQERATLHRITVSTENGDTVATQATSQQIAVGDIAPVQMQGLSRDNGCHTYTATLHFDATASDQTVSGTVTGNFR